MWLKLLSLISQINMTKSFGTKLITWGVRILFAFILAYLGTIVVMYLLGLSLFHNFFLLIGLIFGLFFGIIIRRWWAGLILTLLLVLLYWDDPMFRFLSGRPYFTGISTNITGYDEFTERLFGIFIAASITSFISGYMATIAMRLQPDKFPGPIREV